MAVLAYDPTIDKDMAPLQPAQLVVVPVLDDIDCFVDVNDLSAAPAVGADFTMLLGGLIPDPMARCVSITMFNANSGTARGITVVLFGRNGFGVNVCEPIAFSAKAANTTNITYSRHAYSHLAKVAYISRTGGAVQSNDRLDVGLAWLAGTAAGTHDAANGSAATDYKTMGMPVLLSPADGYGAVDQTDFPVQVHGVILAEATGAQTRAAIGRGGDFGIDTKYRTIRLDEEFVLSGDGNHSAVLSFTPSRGASTWGTIEVSPVIPAPYL